MEAKKKTIIALKGTANSGKSATLKKVYELLKAKYPNAIITHEKNASDIRAIMEINGLKVGIESQGDPGSRIFQSLDIFVREQCVLIVCATRTRGETVEAVNALAAEFTIETIGKLKAPDPSQYDLANNASAAEIMKRITALLS